MRHKALSCVDLTDAIVRCSSRCYERLTWNARAEEKKKCNMKSSRPSQPLSSPNNRDMAIDMCISKTNLCMWYTRLPFSRYGAAKSAPYKLRNSLMLR